jgi:DNA repair protein RadC
MELSEDMPLFLSQKGGEITRQHAHEILNQAFTTAKLQGKVSAHSLRKTYANKLLQQGGNLYAVKEALGHASVQTTQDYLGIGEEQLREATPDFEFDEKSDNKVLSDFTPKDPKIALLEERIKALETQLQSEENEHEKVISFPEPAKRKKSS